MNALTLLSIGLSSLPMTITLVIGLILVATTPRGGTRTIALVGLAVLLVATLLHVGQATLPMMLIESGMETHSVSMALMAVSSVVMLIDVVGMVLVVWALRRALRRNPVGA